MPIHDYNENEHTTNILCWIYYVTCKLCQLLLFLFYVKLISLSVLLPASLFTLSTTFPDLAQLCLPREDCKHGMDSAMVRFSRLCQSDVFVSVLFSFTVLLLVSAQVFLWSLLLLVMISCGDICKLQSTSTPSLWGSNSHFKCQAWNVSDNDANRRTPICVRVKESRADFTFRIWFILEYKTCMHFASWYPAL